MRTSPSRREERADPCKNRVMQTKDPSELRENMEREGKRVRQRKGEEEKRGEKIQEPQRRKNIFSRTVFQSRLFEQRFYGFNKVNNNFGRLNFRMVGVHYPVSSLWDF